MQFRAYIFSLSFVILFSYLNIHPLLKNAAPKVNVEKDMSCSKAKCMREEPVSETNDCDDTEGKECSNEGCNPFLPCSMGYCCYIVENFYSCQENNTVPRQKIAIVNDNRIMSGLSECWHPPEILS